MDAGKEKEKLDEVEGLRLVRAFLSLPPHKRAEVIAFVEELARLHPQPGEGDGAPAR
ncbi:hypothetical protein [Bradyrhizobium sp. B117]|uniref:hypothetical protein n=1 Tax=Bradyrhizobium sp. B117 TaxID=3140246 RepID=UPI0031845D54